MDEKWRIRQNFSEIMLNCIFYVPIPDIIIIFVKIGILVLENNDVTDAGI